jgi:hypothetical protein
MGEALDNLYRVFARYHRPPTFTACGCCFDGVEIEPVGWKGTPRSTVRAVSPGGHKPVRELSQADLEGFIGDVPLTSGDTELFKHYLPRAFELAVEDHTWEYPFAVWGAATWSDPPRFIPWNEWPKDEQQAITDFMLEVWASHCTDDDQYLASAVIEGVIYTAQDMTPFLEIWAEKDPNPLHRQEIFDWNEKPGDERSESVARRNWESTRSWLASSR